MGFIHVANMLSNVLGQGPVSRRLRRAVFRAIGIKIGRKTVIDGGGRILGTNIVFGEGCYINRDCYFDLTGDIVLGDNVAVGFRTTFITSKHEIGPPGRRVGPVVGANITVGSGTWIGANVTLFPGITIGAGSVIVAGSVVTMSVSPNVLVGGNPGRVIRRLETDPFE
jgi:acetyltransferase-like isoleucine patch superfamily enzyme